MTTMIIPPEQTKLIIKGNKGKEPVLDFSGDKLTATGNLDYDEAAKIFFSALRERFATESELESMIALARQKQAEAYKEIRNCIRHKHSFEAIIEYALKGLANEIEEDAYLEVLGK